jgi:hypothetical protein
MAGDCLPLCKNAPAASSIFKIVPQTKDRASGFSYTALYNFCCFQRFDLTGGVAKFA